MKKLLFIALLCFTSLSCSHKPKNEVYICTGRYAKAYHFDPNCKGLNRCKAEIKVVALFEALVEGRTPCRYCVH